DSLSKIGVVWIAAKIFKGQDRNAFFRNSCWLRTARCCRSYLCLRCNCCLTQRDWFLRLLYEFLKARIAAQRIPARVQTQFAIAQKSGRARCDGQLLEGKILLTSPCINEGQVFDQQSALYRIFADRQQLNRAPAFADRVLFVAK